MLELKEEVKEGSNFDFELRRYTKVYKENRAGGMDVKGKVLLQGQVKK